VFLENPKVTRCQKCQKPSEHPFGTFGTPSVRAFEDIRRILGSTLRLWTGLDLSHVYAEDFLVSIIYGYIL
jgi:hypothetical protein